MEHRNTSREIVARPLPRRYLASLEVRAFLAQLLVLLVLAAVSNLLAQERKPSAHEVEAAYLYNFGKFIQWPADSAASRETAFSICTVGSTPVSASLASLLVGEQIEGKNLVPRILFAADDASACRIVFIPSSQQKAVSSLLAVLKDSSTLTVSDFPGFSEHGGMIEFVLQDNRVRFRINLALARKVGLSVSSDLLKVAATVIDERRSIE